jgi:SOS-response transcriptional repressor LexA
MTTWASPHIEKLLEGKTAKFRPRGGSMEGKVSSGQLVTVEPLTDQDLQPGTIVLCRVSGKHYLHLIKQVQTKGDNLRYLIGNNRGSTNGWVARSGIYGICTKVEP